MKCKGCNSEKLFMCQHVKRNKDGIVISREDCGYCIACCPTRQEIIDRFPEAKGKMILIPKAAHE
jgi:predicted aldo/keto reductase-like oxidoreductase